MVINFILTMDTQTMFAIFKQSSALSQRSYDEFVETMQEAGPEGNVLMFSIMEEVMTMQKGCPINAETLVFIVTILMRVRRQNNMGSPPVL
jgi:hypothetical protein